MSQYEVHVLEVGYSTKLTNIINAANCTCTLIKGPKNIIVDTMTPWDKEELLTDLTKHGVTPDQISYVISTHGHADHIGNNNLFLNATHIVGFDIMRATDMFMDYNFAGGASYRIDEYIEILPTSGHTLSHVSVMVETKNDGTVIIAGDLFESEADLQNDQIWINAGSEDPQKQRENRKLVLNLADWIIPGHGPMFKVTPAMKNLNN